MATKEDIAEMRLPFEGLRGKDLKCDCGAGPRDVSPWYEIGPLKAISWHCHNGHLLISGWRALTQKVEQKRFPGEK